MAAAIAAWLLLVYGRLEFRETGILVNGQRLPWRVVESHYWEETASDPLILHLQAGGWRRMMPACSLLVPARLKAEVDTALARCLGELPQ